MKETRVLITCGPTWVPIDDTRVISNISSGELGQRIAQDFQKAGAKVTLLEGPVNCSLKSPSIRTVKFHYYHEFLALFKKELRKNYHTVIHAAAVSDYQLNKAFNVKISSNLKSLTLTLIPTQKIINIIKKISPKSFLIGFKLESKVNHAVAITKGRKLMNDAGCNAVVVNSLHGGKYSAYLVGQNSKILNHSKTKKELSRRIVKLLKAPPLAGQEKLR